MLRQRLEKEPPGKGERMTDDAGDRPPRRPDVFARAFVNALAIAAGLTILLGWAF